MWVFSIPTQLKWDLVIVEERKWVEYFLKQVAYFSLCKREKLAFRKPPLGFMDFSLISFMTTWESWKSRSSHSPLEAPSAFVQFSCRCQRPLLRDFGCKPRKVLLGWPWGMAPGSLTGRSLVREGLDWGNTRTTGIYCPSLFCRGNACSCIKGHLVRYDETVKQLLLILFNHTCDFFLPSPCDSNICHYCLIFLLVY